MKQNGGWRRNKLLCIESSRWRRQSQARLIGSQQLLNEEFKSRNSGEEISDSDKYSAELFPQTHLTPWHTYVMLSFICTRENQDVFAEENQIIEDDTIVEFIRYGRKRQDELWIHCAFVKIKQRTIEQRRTILEMLIMLQIVTGIQFITQ